MTKNEVITNRNEIKHNEINAYGINQQKALKKKKQMKRQTGQKKGRLNCTDLKRLKCLQHSTSVNKYINVTSHISEITVMTVHIIGYQKYL